MQTVSAHTIASALPCRHADAHKGTFGNVAIIGGNTGMVGAALLAARAALFTGAGRIYLSFLASDAPSVDIMQPEIMCRPLVSVHQLSLNAIVIGPGLGKGSEALHQLGLCLANHTNSLLIDADGLNNIAANTYLQQQLSARQAPTVLTPHPSEAARLLNISTTQIQADRQAAACALAKRFNCCIVLKGTSSLCTNAQGDCTINTTGNVALATGGTGDVLSGVIGALLAQGVSPYDAAQLGVYLHGLAADTLVVRGIGPAGLTASELIPEIRYQLNQLYRQHHATKNE